jgi:hypothetical protein
MAVLRAVGHVAGTGGRRTSVHGRRAHRSFPLAERSRRARPGAGEPVADPDVASLAEMAIFILVLLVGLAHAARRGLLRWV